MHALIALAATVCFCFYVLRKDLRGQPEVSPSLWIPTLWMLRCASRSIDYWLSGHGMELATVDSTGIERAGVDLFLLLALIFAGLMALARRRTDWRELIRDNAWLFVFFAYIGLSSVWSPEPFVSFKRFIRTFGDLIMALLTMTEGRPLLALFTVIRRTAIFFVPLSLLVCKYFATYGRLRSKHLSEPDMWVGIATHKNSMAAFLMIAALYFIWDMIRVRRDGTTLVKLPGPRWLSVNVVYLLMIAVLMLKHSARSSTALTSLAAGCFMLGVFQHVGSDRRRFTTWMLGAACLVLAAQAVCLVLTGSSISNFILELQGKSTDLTGRTEYWPVLIHMGFKNPFLGAGYGAFWTDEVKDYFLRLSIWGGLPDAHNGYIETFLNLGLLGLGLLFINLFKTLRTAWQSLAFEFEYARIRLVLLAMILLHNCAEAGFPRENHIVWLVFLMVAINAQSSASSEDGFDDSTEESELQEAQELPPSAVALSPL